MRSARHSLEEFAGDLEELNVAIRPPRTEQIAVRLYKDDLDALRSLAPEQCVGHTTLARSVLEGCWRAREPGAAEDIVGRLAGRRRLRGPHPLATSAQPLGRYAFGSSSHDGLKTKGEPL